MDASGLFFLFGGLAVGLAAVCYLIATDRQRFLARFELGQWRESFYLRALPNFLQAMYDHHLPTAWPSRRNAVAAALFRLRTRPLLRMKSPSLRRAMLQQHIILFALLETLRPYLRDFFLHQQQRIVGERILAMEDTIERDRLILYLEALRHERASFYASLTSQDRATLVAMAQRNIIAKLRTAHAIFQEHGYSLLPEFTELRRWEQMSGVELVQELPVATSRRVRRAAMEKRRRSPGLGV
jgi:hypothetical protein